MPACMYFYQSVVVHNARRTPKGEVSEQFEPHRTYVKHSQTVIAIQTKPHNYTYQHIRQFHNS